MADLTYGRLDDVLCALGFSSRLTADPKARVYEHKETGALIALPILPEGQKVLPRHLLAVRAILDAFGIADNAELALHS